MATSGISFIIREQAVIIDGGPGAELPDRSAPPLAAGPQAVIVMGRVPADAPTTIRVDTQADRAPLIEAYDGTLETPDGYIRIVSVLDEVFASVPVRGERTRIRIFLTDLDEPDEIHFVLP